MVSYDRFFYFFILINQKEPHLCDYWRGSLKSAINDSGTSWYIKAILIVTMHFCKAHNSNSATPKLTNVTKSETPTNAPRGEIDLALTLHNPFKFMNKNLNFFSHQIYSIRILMK